LRLPPSRRCALDRVQHSTPRLALPARNVPGATVQAPSPPTSPRPTWPSLHAFRFHLRNSSARVPLVWPVRPPATGGSGRPSANRVFALAPMSSRDRASRSARPEGEPIQDTHVDDIRTGTARTRLQRHMYRGSGLGTERNGLFPTAAADARFGRFPADRSGSAVTSAAPAVLVSPPSLCLPSKQKVGVSEPFLSPSHPPEPTA
jgi:hypothetical protein